MHNKLMSLLTGAWLLSVAFSVLAEDAGTVTFPDRHSAFVATPPEVVEQEMIVMPTAVVNPSVQFSRVMDVLFAFEKSSVEGMLPDGRAALDNLVVQIQNENVILNPIVVSGHADRIGSAESNYALSFARAATVRDYLIGKGIHSNLFIIQGVGATEQVAYCPIGNTPLIIRCLGADRRVTLDVSGEKR